MKELNLLAISGSLRKLSYNTHVITALKNMGQENIKITIGFINDLPLFNPDRENENIPALNRLKLALNKSDGLIIASPEYAHGISGPLKNALDWLVSGVEFPDTPIMLINTSPRASHAQLALREVLTTMSGNIIEAASVSILLLGRELDADGILANQDMRRLLEAGLKQFSNEIHAIR